MTTTYQEETSYYSQAQARQAAYFQAQDTYAGLISTGTPSDVDSYYCTIKVLPDPTNVRSMFLKSQILERSGDTSQDTTTGTLLSTQWFNLAINFNALVKPPAKRRVESIDTFFSR